MARSSAVRGGRVVALLLGSAVATVTALAGCTSSDGQHGASGTPSPTRQAAASPAPHAAPSVQELADRFRRTDTHSAHVTMTVTVDSSKLEHGSGAYQSTPNGLDMRMGLTIYPLNRKRATAVPEGVRPTSRPAEPRVRTLRADAGAAADATTRRIEVIALGGNLYLKVYGKHPESGKSWRKLNTTDPATRAGTAARVARLTEQQIDPTTLLKRVRAAGTITRAARDEVGGRPTTHYSISMDTMRAAKSLEKPELRSVATKRAATLPPTYDMDMWFTPSHLPVKVVVRERMPELGQATVTVRYSKWAQPVSITAPPADQVSIDPNR